MKKLIGIFAIALPFICSSQISTSEKEETIQKILEVLEKRYIFPEVADSMVRYVNTFAESGKYDTISTREEFAFQLTTDLQFVSKDLHLKVQFDEQSPKQAEKSENENFTEDEWIRSLMVENNYGIKSKKILDGNIGYLEIPMFGPLNLVADSIRSAIHFIENTDVLILDLRSCRGSLDENTIPFLCSYFFDEPVHLFDFYTRETNSTKQFWTYAWVPGEKYLEKPIYILTSGRTFSGGEELAYDLKHLNRAEIIGEKTKGGANPTDYVRLNRSYSASVPYMRSINPGTNTNWEHIGVQPDIEVKSNMALYTAHVDALSWLYQTTIDENQRIALNKTLKEVEAGKPQFRQIEFKLKGFENAKEVFIAGSFNSWAAKNIPLKKQDGYWTGNVECEPGNVSYQFIVDGRWITDPENPQIVTENGYKHSFLFVK
ncbi:hypothetical protein GM418_23460 [Maribellus comscasis]|uniref:Tail specific protease domain-containing protein n=1 Tax=Maribellus comscasis TaxID=2681766 RepID=A0A6I6JZD4_9BACT|nr:S41 family peptidase [Maribellus comscasis]QGY46510.1 hypothetical protein GM418_23460 [Maribellus comscasis]